MNMKNELTTYKTLLLFAFVIQLLIDVGGFSEWYYNQYPEEVFASAGYASLLSFEYSMAAYLLWALLYYLSVIFMLLFSKAAKPVIIACLVLAPVYMSAGGIYVGTPYESVLGFAGWTSYIFACAMVFWGPKTSAMFANE